MKKIHRILSYEPEGRVEYHLSEDEMKVMRKAVDLVLSAPDCEDSSDFMFDAMDIAKELANIEFPD